MERELWPLLYRTLREVGRTVHQKGVTYQPWILVAVILWAALHDRPISWACRVPNWSTTRLRPLRLPSASTVSRRGYGVGVGLVWRALEERLRQSGRESPAVSAASVVVASLVSSLDGKPLVVGGYSKDRQAKLGRATNAFARGYKLHALWPNRPLPEAWDLTPLNAAETVVAEALLGQLAGAGPHGGYLLADGNYDSSRLFDAAAAAGYQLLVPAGAGAGGGHRYQSPFRLRSIALMSTSFGQEIYHGRHRIECLFGNAATFAGGLMPLPAWVRHGPRVRTWVWAKLLINAARILRNQRLNQRLAA